MDLSKGVHAEEMVDRVGLAIWVPFCDTSRDASLMTYAGIPSVDAMSLHSLRTMSLILEVFLEVWLNMILEGVLLAKTSELRV